MMNVAITGGSGMELIKKNLEIFQMSPFIARIGV